MDKNSRKQKEITNIYESGSFIRLDMAKFIPHYGVSEASDEDNVSSKFVRIVSNRTGLEPYKAYIKSSLKRTPPLPKQVNVANHFYGHQVRNKNKCIQTLDEILKYKKLLMFIFCSCENVSDHFLETLKTFYQDLEIYQPIIELILCPMDATKTKADDNFRKHYNYLAFEGKTQFIWQLRYMYNVTELKASAIVVRGTGELITRDPFNDIDKYGSNAVNNWLI